ncbi:MAG: hypothetical protein VX610_10460 [SAR324 cluster bacterium]|nr:hypothetical protein [SAR324 cluster bacterium]
MPTGTPLPLRLGILGLVLGLHVALIPLVVQWFRPPPPLENPLLIELEHWTPPAPMLPGSQPELSSQPLAAPSPAEKPPVPQPPVEELETDQLEDLIQETPAEQLSMKQLKSASRPPEPKPPAPEPKPAEQPQTQRSTDAAAPTPQPAETDAESAESEEKLLARLEPNLPSPARSPGQPALPPQPQSAGVVPQVAEPPPLPKQWFLREGMTEPPKLLKLSGALQAGGELPKPANPALSQNQPSAIPPPPGMGDSGQPGGGFFTLNSYDWPYESYMGRWAKTLRYTWGNNPPLDYARGLRPQGGDVFVLVRVSRSGMLNSYEVTNVVLASPEMEASVISALLASGQLPALPEDFTEDELVIHFRFIYPPLR